MLPKKRKKIPGETLLSTMRNPAQQNQRSCLRNTIGYIFFTWFLRKKPGTIKIKSNCLFQVPS
jgi:hypothetical protein